MVVEALIRRLSRWNEGRTDELLYEGEIIQDCYEAPQNATNISKLSQKFKVLMSKGNVNRALKLLRNSMSNGILLLPNKALDLLKQKHPEFKESSQETLLQGPFRPIHPAAYFYSHLNMEDITDADYEHTKRVCKVFEIKNLGEHDDLYVQSNTLLLGMDLRNFEICVLKYMSLKYLCCKISLSFWISMANSFRKD